MIWSSLGNSAVIVLFWSSTTRCIVGGGIPLYMAPEAWDFSKKWTFILMFYELETLRYPYGPIPHTYEDYKNAHLYSAIVSLKLCGKLSRRHFIDF